MSDVRIYRGELPPDIQKLIDSAPPIGGSEKESEAPKTGSLLFDAEFVADSLKSDVVEELIRAMKRQGVTKSELAARVGKSRQYVTHVLNETANFTLETIAELACALEQRVTVKMYTPGETVVVRPVRDARRNGAGR